MLTLWTVHTWIPEQAEQSPYLDVSSPEKQCGKSQVGKTAALVVRRPWSVITPSEAVVYRKIEQDRPTLLMDEVDTIFGAKAAGNYEALRALLNAGNERGTSVPRVMKAGNAGNMELQEFSIFCPKMLMGIGRLPDTVTDRSIPIRMARKSRSQKVERFRARDVETVAAPLRARLSRWAAAANLTDARPHLPINSPTPTGLLGAAAGHCWTKRAETGRNVLAGRRLCFPPAGPRNPNRSASVLLADVRAIFPTMATADGLPTQTNSRSAQGDGGITLARTERQRHQPRRRPELLDPYGVKPGQHRFEGQSVKGYLREPFLDPWERSCSPSHPRKRHAIRNIRNNVPICSTKSTKNNPKHGALHGR